jgi:integrase
MASGRAEPSTEADTPGASGRMAPPRPSWSERYGERHRLERVVDLPRGIVGPRRVRLYLRSGHYVLQWWDPAARRTLSDRVDGDLVAAIGRARQIEERLDHLRDSGMGRRRLGHRELVDAFLADLGRRADAGEVGPATVRRYAAALAHYLAFAERPDVARSHPHAAGVDRPFRLAFAAFLAGRLVPRNGRRAAAPAPMRGQAFVEDAARAMFAWAADPGRGRLMPAGFVNPFAGVAKVRRATAADPLGEPDITMAMAAEFLLACDAYQLRLFAPLVFFGLRASEPCYLFGEHVDDGWLRVPCLPDLGYVTKGRRDKRFPLAGALSAVLAAGRPASMPGLLFLRRGVIEGRERPPLLGWDLRGLVDEYRRRSARARSLGAAGRTRLRDDVLRDAGGIRYDHLQGEFAGLSRTLTWPASATPKDFRHLFATGLENAGVPEHYRRYMMGHAPGRAAITAYTHLNRLSENYESALRGEWAPLADALARRAAEVGLIAMPTTATSAPTV